MPETYIEKLQLLDASSGSKLCQSASQMSTTSESATNLVQHASGKGRLHCVGDRNSNFLRDTSMHRSHLRILLK
jgi:hypothetical protein